MVIIRKTKGNKSEDVEKLEPLCTVGGGDANWCSTCVNIMEDPQIIENGTTIGSGNITPGYLYEIMDLKKLNSLFKTPEKNNH